MATIAVSPAAAQQASQEGTQIGSCGISGNATLSPRAEATFSLRAEHDSLYFDGVIIGRAQAGWRGFGGTRQQLVQPSRAGAPEFLTGATIDTLFLQFDRDARVAWVHMLKVPLDTNNVVLVDRVDTQGGAPVVIGLAKVPSPVPVKWGCRDRNFVEQLEDLIVKALTSIPSIAAFVGPASPQ